MGEGKDGMVSTACENDEGRGGEEGEDGTNDEATDGVAFHTVVSWPPLSFSLTGKRTFSLHAVEEGAREKSATEEDRPTDAERQIEADGKGEVEKCGSESGTTPPGLAISALPVPPFASIVGFPSSAVAVVVAVASPGFPEVVEKLVVPLSPT